MHPHEVEFQIRNLSRVHTFKGAESILIELKNYSGKLTEDQLSRLCFAAITNEQIYKCYNCKHHLKVILKKNEENIPAESSSKAEEIEGLEFTEDQLADMYAEETEKLGEEGIF